MDPSRLYTLIEPFLHYWECRKLGHGRIKSTAATVHYLKEVNGRTVNPRKDLINERFHRKPWQLMTAHERGIITSKLSFIDNMLHFMATADEDFLHEAVRDVSRHWK